MAGVPATALTRSSRRRGRASGDGSVLYRLDVAGRALAAIVGGFVLASAASILIAAVLIALGAHTRGRAVHAGMELSWLVWTGAAMWAFYARTQAKAWAGLLGPAAACASLAFILGFGG